MSVLAAPTTTPLLVRALVGFPGPPSSDVAICGTGQSCCSVYCREWVPQSAPPTGPDEWGADTGASPVPSALIVYSAFCSTRPQRTNTSLAPSGDQAGAKSIVRPVS